MIEIAVFLIVFLLLIYFSVMLLRGKTNMKGGEYMTFVRDGESFCPSVSQLCLMILSNRTYSPYIKMRKVARKSGTSIPISPITTTSIYSPSKVYSKNEFKYVPDFKTLCENSAQYIITQSTVFIDSKPWYIRTLLSDKRVSDANIDLYGINDKITTGYGVCECSTLDHKPKNGQVISLISNNYSEQNDYYLINNNYLRLIVSGDKFIPLINELNKQSKFRIYIEFVYGNINYHEECKKNMYIKIHERTVNVLDHIIDYINSISSTNSKTYLFILRFYVNNNGSFYFDFDHESLFKQSDFSYNELNYVHNILMRERNTGKRNDIIHKVYLKVNPDISSLKLVHEVDPISKYIDPLIRERNNKRSICNYTIDSDKYHVLIYDEIRFYNLLNRDPLFTNINIPQSEKWYCDEWLSFIANDKLINAQIEHSENLSHHKSNIIEFLLRNINDKDLLIKIITDGLTYILKH